MALKGKQKKLDKNKDGKITGADFALMRKGGYKMGGEFKMNDSDRMTKRDIERASNAVQGKKYKTGPMPGNKAAAASMSTDRMTRRDNEIASRAVGKKIGGEMKQESKGRRMSKDELKLAKEMSKRDRYQSYAKNEKTRAFKTPKEAAEVDIKLQKLIDYNVKKGDPVDVDVIGMKSYEKPTSKMGSFESGGLSDTMKKLRKKAYEKSGKKSKNIGKFGDDEYMIQKKLPGMKKGKMIKAKTGKSVDTIKITPTIKGKPLKARPFMKSKFDSGVRSRDYKFSKK